jgi:hypothetical protein
MEFDKDKVDEVTLALLYLVTTKNKHGHRAWKGFDWSTMDRLYEKGYISDPKSKTKSVAMTDEAANLSAQLFKKHFA